MSRYRKSIDVYITIGKEGNYMNKAVIVFCMALMMALGLNFIFTATTAATANATSDSCNSEGCNGDYTCINPNQPPGAKGCPNDPKGG
jgi:hypothetical protein